MSVTIKIVALTHEGIVALNKCVIDAAREDVNYKKKKIFDAFVDTDYRTNPSIYTLQLKKREVKLMRALRYLGLSYEKISMLWVQNVPRMIDEINTAMRKNGADIIKDYKVVVE